MASFILMSDKFSEPISRVVVGEAYEDDDEFDIMNFQIQQWCLKSVGNFNIGQQLRGGIPPSPHPPAWAMLLYLRANAIRVLLVRPFFLFNTPAAASRRNIRPALDLIMETIDALSTLDRTTDIYRKHHVWFQHILTSTSSLLFLVIAYVEQNRASLSTELRGGLLDSVARSFRNAFGLAVAYSKSSIASRRLWKRMVQMKTMLIEVGTLPASQFAEAPTGRLSHIRPEQQPPGVDDTTTANKTSNGDFWDVGGSGGEKNMGVALEPALIDLDLYSALNSSPSDSMAGLGTQGFSVEWAASLSENWQLNNGNGFFLGF
jgi:hypothetical protein